MPSDVCFYFLPYFEVGRNGAMILHPESGINVDLFLLFFIISAEEREKSLFQPPKSAFN